MPKLQASGAFAQALDDNARALNGAYWKVYAAGTTTQATTYSNALLTIANAWPEIGGAAGRIPDIYVAPGNYRIRVETAGGVLIAESDNNVVYGLDPGEVAVAKFKTVALMLADETMGYSLGGAVSTIVVAGDIVEAGCFRYSVSASGATDNDLATAGGIKLVILEAPCGTLPAEATGAIFDGATDTAAILNALSASRANYTGTIGLPAGKTAYLDATWTLPRHASLAGNGATLTSSGSTGTFDAAALLKRGATPVAIASLSATPVKGDTTLTFFSGHGLSVGDTIMLYNPTNGSYTTFRDNYREGEFCKVLSITNSTEVEVSSPIYGRYVSSEAIVYHCADMATGNISDVTVIAPGAGANAAINAWRMDLCEGLKLVNTASRNSGNASASLKNCYRCEGRGMDEKQQGTAAGTTTYYGLGIANCQDLKISGIFEGNRHGIAISGFDDFAIVNRGILVTDFECKNAAQATAAADWHGNVEYSTTQTGFAMVGLNIAGDFNTISNVQVMGGDETLGILAREVAGFSHLISGVTILTKSNDTTRGGGIDIGGNSSPVTSATRRGGVIKIIDCTMNLFAHEGHAIRVRNRGYVGEDWGVCVRGLTLRAANMPSNFAYLRFDTVSGDEPKSVEMTNWQTVDTSNITPLSNTSASVLVRMSPVSGVEELTTSTGVRFVENLASMPIEFPKLPNVSCALIGAPTTGTDTIAPQITLLNTTQIRSRITRMDDPSANFTAAATRSVSWVATLAEF